MRLLSSPTAALAAATALLALDTVSSFQAFHPSSNRLQSSHSNGLVPKHSGEFLVSSSSRVSTLPHLRRATPAGHHDETARNTRCLDSHKQQAPFKAWPLLGNWALVRMRAQRWFRHCHRTVTSTAVALLVVFACHSGSALAVSGGRMGGSFGATNRFSPPSYGSPSTTSRSMPSSGRYHHQHHAPRIHVHTGSSGGSSSLHGSFTTQDTFPGGTVAKASRFSASDIVLLTTTATVMAYGFTNNKRQQDGGGAVSPLGPGATVASMTISLHVQDRYDPDSLLNRLKDISKQCDTNQRQGVQNLVSEVALELLRQEENIVSATAHSKQFSKIGPAQREFQRLSVQGRSKFDRETVNKFGDQDSPDRARTTSDTGEDESPATSVTATTAVVSLKLSIEGDSTRLPYIRYRRDVRESLERIAADAQVEDCLLSAEILWAPENDDDRLTPDDIYTSYPDLVPL